MAAYSNLCRWWWIVLLSCMVLVGDKNEVFGCLEDENIGLFKLKDVFNHQEISVYQSWSDEETDCCRWNWITCDVFSKRIINLQLGPFQHEPENLDQWFLDASLFQPFKQLQNLTLSFQYFKFRGFKGQLKLTKLQVLDLSVNGMYHVPLLGELPSLKFLNLSYNGISDGFEGVEGTQRPTKLQVLDLSHNAITQVTLLGDLPSLKFLDLSFNEFSHGFKGFRNMSNLEILILEYNSYDLGEIPPSIWAMASLKLLRLTTDSLSGSLPEGICALTNLEELDLSINELQGVIPTCLSNLTSLRLLDLSENQFSGTIPSNLMSSLKSLESVSLSKNHFEGLFSFSSFADNSKLEVFELESYNPRLQIDTESIQWEHPIFQLKNLILSNCIVNTIPSFLLSQYDLRIVDLSNNGMTGELPSWLLTNNSRLEFLSLRNNSFIGRLTLQLDSFNAYLSILDVSMNQVGGEIPTFIGSIFPSLDYWNMSTNAIEGSIPSSIEKMNELIFLDLSNNRLSGEIPKSLFNGCKDLEYFNLSNNKLGGNLHPIKMSKFSLGGVRVLDISINSISGTFPDWISKLSFLTTLVMSKNHFEGKLPDSFCNLTKVTYIDLSLNNFGDILPPCLNLLWLQFFHLQGNRFHGPLPISLSRSSSMVTLDARDNNFSGLIPAWISSFGILRILLLNGNIFHGSIPSQLCQMENLNILDLAANNLSGYVPPCLSHIPFGKQNVEIFDLTHRGDYTDYGSYSYENLQRITQYLPYLNLGYDIDIGEEVQFFTKRLMGSYKGNILYFMSGIDLSLNKLTGPVPLLTGNWDMVHSLNLSYNNFNGSIPSTL